MVCNEDNTELNPSATMEFTVHGMQEAIFPYS